MAVVDSEKPAEKTGDTAPRSSTAEQQKKAKGPGAWIKKNKVAAGAIAVGAGILIMSHKGSKAGTGENSKALIEAEEAQRAAQIEGGIVPASAAGPGGGGEGSSGSGSAGTVTPTPANPTGTGEAGDPKLAAAVEALGGDVAGLAAAQHETAPAAEAGAAPKAQAAAKKKKPAPKKEAKKKVGKKTSQHGGVTINGRHFAGATGSSLGPVIHSSNGETHRTVTIHYGGRTETLISHNGGASWTHNAPGHTPPSRGPAHHTTRTAPHPVHHAPPAKHPAKPKPKPAPKHTTVRKHRRVAA